LIYLDTSVLVALYVPEELSARAERLVRAAREPMLSELGILEFFSAISRKVRAGELGAADGRRITAKLLAHVEEGVYSRIPFEPSHYRLAREWIGQFTLPLRSLDALHLALSSTAKTRIATADRMLATSARRIGIPAVTLRAGRATGKP
jgi:predicted nucleic acid-binding protein